MEDENRIKVLVIEDNPGDVYLLRVLLSQAENVAVDMEHADSLSAALSFLSTIKVDVILSDLGLPDSQGIDTFLSVHKQFPDIPVIVLSGLEDEALAVEAVRKGAQDYLFKGKVESGLLVKALRYSIERQKLITALERSLKEIRTLRGLLPICAWCKNVRDDKGYWKKVETYVEEHTDASFTHGICPKCLKRVYPDAFEHLKKDNPDLLKDEGDE
ncbi:MAG: response regulator [Nitrospirae bacterium]|nr:response regulator [Nitrospirota bacterium]